MKRKNLILLMLAALLLNCGFAAADYYVATNGDNDSNGTYTEPWETITHARDVIRNQLATDANQSFTVWIRDGRYNLTDTVVFGPNDSPNDGNLVRYMAYPGETPIFFGGVAITDWNEVDIEDEPAGLDPNASGNLYSTSTPLKFKTLWKANAELPRARGVGWIPRIDANDVRASKWKIWYNDTDSTKPEIKNTWDFNDVEVVIRPGFCWTLN